MFLPCHSALIALVWFGLTQIFTWNCYQIQLFSCLAFRGMYVWCLPACVRPCCECLMRGTITLTGKSLMLHIDKFSSLFSFFTLSTHCAEIYRKYQYLRLLRFNYFVWNRVMLFFIHTHTYIYVYSSISQVHIMFRFQFVIKNTLLSLLLLLLFFFFNQLF